MAWEVVSIVVEGMRRERRMIPFVLVHVTRDNIESTPRYCEVGGVLKERHGEQRGCDGSRYGPSIVTKEWL